jgi:hypothetical protein
MRWHGKINQMIRRRVNCSIKWMHKCQAKNKLQETVPPVNNLMRANFLKRTLSHQCSPLNPPNRRTWLYKLPPFKLSFRNICRDSFFLSKNSLCKSNLRLFRTKSRVLVKTLGNRAPMAVPRFPFPAKLLARSRLPHMNFRSTPTSRCTQTCKAKTLPW